jgi:hypothetical protein
VYGPRKLSARFLYLGQHISSHGVSYTVDEHSFPVHASCGENQNVGYMNGKGKYDYAACSTYIIVLGRTTRCVVSGNNIVEYGPLGID